MDRRRWLVDVVTRRDYSSDYPGSAPPSLWVVVDKRGHLYGGGAHSTLEGAEGTLRRSVQRDELTIRRYDLTEDPCGPTTFAATNPIRITVR